VPNAGGIVTISGAEVGGGALGAILGQELIGIIVGPGDSGDIVSTCT